MSASKSGLTEPELEDLLSLDNNNGERIRVDRLVAKQPLSFQIKEEQTILNYRKLTELPHHLLCSAQLDQLKKETLCDFEFLLGKLRATAIDAVLEDFTEARNVWGDDDDVRIVEKFLRLSSMALRKDPRQFASQVIGRLQCFVNSGQSLCISKIVKDAYNSSVPCFIPSYQCLSPSEGSLLSSTEVVDQNAVCEFSCDGKTVFVG